LKTLLSGVEPELRGPCRFLAALRNFHGSFAAASRMQEHFAKRNRHERNQLIPADENVGSRLEPSLSTSRKVILAEQSQFFLKLLVAQGFGRAVAETCGVSSLINIGYGIGR
jgi:hypothetical protein